ncbi:MAG: transposase [Ignavibacteria bacterium]|nr:transposase [Ignavibacteria bacterium]MBK9334605.1 transposase [Ignavibacteria bacterium]
MSEKKRYTSEQKIIILRDLLEKNMPISQISEKHNVHVNDIYNHKKIEDLEEFLLPVMLLQFLNQNPQQINHL